MDIEYIRDLIRKERYTILEHANMRKTQRVISEEEIKSALLGGQIIQDYPGWQPLPRCVVRSIATTYRPIEVVCDIDEEFGWLQ